MAIALGEVISDPVRILQLRERLECEPEARVLVSACLAGHPVRYDGGHCFDDSFSALLNSGKAILVCPEVLGGLSVPRPPAELQGGLRNLPVVQSVQGQDVTESFELGAERALDQARGQTILFALLKSKSPSCGVGQVYDGSFSGRLVPGDGVATARFRSAGIPVICSDVWRSSGG